VTIENFLHYWSQHNTMIIEGLIGLVILLSLFLAYRSFFGNKEGAADTHASNGHAGLDAGQLEKTLQKILENQHLGSKLSANADDHAQVTDAHAAAPIPATAEGGDTAAEVVQLRAALNDNSKKMEIMKSQLAQAQEQVTAATAAAAAAGSAPAPAGDAGISSEERDELNGKLRDLEARLAEYEIISEDIADLSKYREENDDLKKQIEALKSAPAAAAPATPAAPPAAAPQPPPAAAAAPPPQPPPPAPEPEAPAAPKLAAPDPEPDLMAAVAEMSPEPAAPAEESSSIIDDDLMKEFAAAVEGQKALDQAADKAGDGSEKATKNPDDTDKLMDQFEDFVGNKKS
jgi:hypothetical protein